MSIQGKMWVDLRHPQHTRNEEAWAFTEAHYDAQQLYAALKLYVTRKAIGEADEAYTERLGITKYLPVLAAVIDSIIGGVARRDVDVSRRWGALEQEGLSRVLQRDADMLGTTWSHFQLHKLTQSVVFNGCWTLVDTTRKPGQAVTRADMGVAGVRPYVRLITPDQLVNWLQDDTGRMTMALIEEYVDVRADLEGSVEDAERQQYLHLTLDGWRRLRPEKDAQGQQVLRVVGAGGWARPWQDRWGRERLPLVQLRPQTRRYAAYELAQLANEVLNINSELRYILRFGGLGQYMVLGLEDEAFTRQLEDINKGSRVLQEDVEASPKARFIGPDVGVIDGMVRTIDSKITQFWQAAMYEFSDQAAERTATEIRGDFASSLGATLASLSEALDESENDELWLLAQAAGYTGGSDEDGAPMVTRPRDFTTEDAISVVTRMRDVIKGQNQPLVITPEIDAALTTVAVDKLGLADFFERGIEDVYKTVLEKAEAAPGPPRQVEPAEGGDEEVREPGVVTGGSAE